MHGVEQYYDNVHTHSHTHTHTHVHTHTHSLSHTHTLTLSHTHTHILTQYFLFGLVLVRPHNPLCEAHEAHQLTHLSRACYLLASTVHIRSSSLLFAEQACCTVYFILY